MQEFSSISVSSYEAGSLADRLTEQAGHGWDVVAIVPTGSTITAYLARESTGDSTPAGSAAPAAESVSSWSADAEQAAPVEPEISVPEVSMPEVSAPEPSMPELSVPEVSMPEVVTAVPEITVPEVSVPPVVEPVNEPAGWAIAPESANEPSTTSDPAAGLSSGSAAIAAAAHEVAAAPAAEVAPTAEVAATAVVPEQQVQQAAASAAPAGWYADPSSRFELRYWDGTQWTEHVSRGGQQFTDPPVA